MGFSVSNTAFLFFFRVKYFLFEIKQCIIHDIFKVCFHLKSDCGPNDYFACQKWFCWQYKVYFQPYRFFVSSVLFLIGRWLDDLEIDQSIGTFSSYYFRLSKIYAYFSLKSAVKYDEAYISTLMVTIIISPFSELYLLWLFFVICSYLPNALPLKGDVVSVLQH